MRPTGLRLRSRRAFTLVEVLAALTLAAVILPVAMRGVSLALAAASHARRQAQAVTLAEAKQSELVVTDGWQSGSLSGDFGEDCPDFTWTAEASEWDSATLRRLDVHVSWKSANRDRLVTLTTLVRTESE